MAFNYIALVQSENSWEELHAIVARYTDAISVFPIDSSGANSRALGISVNAGSDINRAAEMTTALFHELWQNFDVTVYELYSGQVMTPQSLPESIRRMVGD